MGCLGRFRVQPACLSFLDESGIGWIKVSIFHMESFNFMHNIKVSHGRCGDVHCPGLKNCIKKIISRTPAIKVLEKVLDQHSQILKSCSIEGEWSDIPGSRNDALEKLGSWTQLSLTTILSSFLH